MNQQMKTNNIIVDGNEGYQKAKNFMKFLMPESVKKIKKYRGKRKHHPDHTLKSEATHFDVYVVNEYKY